MLSWHICVGYDLGDVFVWQKYPEKSKQYMKLTKFLQKVNTAYNFARFYATFIFHITLIFILI